MDEFSKRFTNNPKLVFHDISNEDYRIYYYPTGKVRIEKPVAVCWKETPPNINFGGGSHRVVDQNDRCYYLPPGWIAMEWEKKDKDGVVPYEF